MCTTVLRKHQMLYQKFNGVHVFPFTDNYLYMACMPIQYSVPRVLSMSLPVWNIEFNFYFFILYLKDYMKFLKYKNFFLLTYLFENLVLL